VYFFLVFAQFQLLHPFSTLGRHPTLSGFLILTLFKPPNVVRVVSAV
jgi:hypothetical protein